MMREEQGFNSFSNPLNKNELQKVCLKLPNFTLYVDI